MGEITCQLHNNDPENSIKVTYFYYYLFLFVSGTVKPPPLHSHRYLTGYGQETGGITCQLYNNDPENSVKVLYLETVPWYVRLYLHTLEVTNDVKLIEPGNIIIKFDIPVVGPGFSIPLKFPTVS